MEIKDTEWYKRGRDYPPYTEAGIKMAMTMSGKEVQKWFTPHELREYPKPEAYTGALP